MKPTDHNGDPLTYWGGLEEPKQEIMYTEKEVFLFLNTLWDRLDIWYNEDSDKEFSLRKWFDECELKKTRYEK